MKSSPSAQRVSVSASESCSVPFSSVCLSDSVSSVLLFNCIIKPFSYSGRSVSEQPPHPVPAFSPSHPFKSMKLHRPFLSPLTLWILCSLSFCEYFSLPLRFLPLSLSLFECSRPRLSVSLPVCLSLPLSVISAGQLARFHKTSSVLRWLDFKMSDEIQRAVIFSFFLFF